VVEDDDAIDIEDAQVHAPGMQIDPTVKSVLSPFYLGTGAPHGRP
jgi:hypothetical protein